MSNARISIAEEKVFTSTDFGWLYRLINGKLSDRQLSASEELELRQLSVKLWALDTAMADRRKGV